MAGAAADPPLNLADDADLAEEEEGAAAANAEEGAPTPVAPAAVVPAPIAAPAPSWASRWLTAEARALRELLGCAVGVVGVIFVLAALSLIHI